VRRWIHLACVEPPPPRRSRPAGEHFCCFAKRSNQEKATREFTKPGHLALRARLLRCSICRAAAQLAALREAQTVLAEFPRQTCAARRRTREIIGARTSGPKEIEPGLFMSLDEATTFIRGLVDARVARNAGEAQP